MTDITIPVLIVGGGPIGLLGGQLLGKQGIPALIVEKHAGRLEAPKAHALNPRSLEICAAAGLPMDRIHSVATPPHEGHYVRMVETVAKGDIGSLAYERQDDAVRALTPWPLINIAQPRFEEVVEAAVATMPGVEIRRGLGAAVDGDAPVKMDGVALDADLATCVPPGRDLRTPLGHHGARTLEHDAPACGREAVRLHDARDVHGLVHDRACGCGGELDAAFRGADAACVLDERFGVRAVILRDGLGDLVADGKRDQLITIEVERKGRAGAQRHAAVSGRDDPVIDHMRRYEGGKARIADRDRALVDDRSLRVVRAVEAQQAARHEGVIADIMRGGTTVTITRTAACPAFTTTVGPVTYTISDGLGGSATGTITPVITCENISN